ncbi:hypothetical protein V8E53_007620 [Lactarius tabidus]
MSPELGLGVYLFQDSCHAMSGGGAIEERAGHIRRVTEGGDSSRSICMTFGERNSGVAAVRQRLSSVQTSRARSRVVDHSVLVAQEGVGSVTISCLPLPRVWAFVLGGAYEGEKDTCIFGARVESQERVECAKGTLGSGTRYRGGGHHYLGATRAVSRGRQGTTSHVIAVGLATTVRLITPINAITSPVAESPVTCIILTSPASLPMPTRLISQTSSSQHRRLLKSLATITTSQQIPTILGTGNGTGDQAKVRCAATRIVGAPSSSTSLRAEYGDVGTYTIVASKGQSIDGVLRRLPAAHLIPQEANAQEVMLKKPNHDQDKCGADDQKANACRPSPQEVKSRPPPQLRSPSGVLRK